MSITHKSKKHSPVVRIIIRAISAIILFIIVWQAYLLIFPHSRVTFKTYKPTGYSIHGAREILYTENILVQGLHNVFNPQVMIFYRLQPTNLSVLERRVSYTEPSCEQVADNQTCSLERTNGGRRYSLTTTTNAYLKDDRGMTSKDQEAEVVIGNVSINITSDDRLHWSKTQWDTFIDSFERSRFPGLNSRWEQPGP